MRLRTALVLSFAVVAVILGPGLIADRREAADRTPEAPATEAATPEPSMQTAALPTPVPEAAAPEAVPEVTPRWPAFDIPAFREALSLYRAGDPAAADAAAARVPDPATRDTLEWIAIRSAGAGIERARIEAFLARNPDWPGAAAFRRRIEAQFLQSAPAADDVLVFFDGQPPATVAGKLAYSRALAGGGRGEEALALARALWHEEPLSTTARRSLLDTHGGNLTADDHRIRMRNLLYAGEWETAAEAALRAGRDEVALAEAFTAVTKRTRDAAKLLQTVPASLQDAPEWLLAKSRLERRGGDLKAAAGALAQAAPKPAPKPAPEPTAAPSPAANERTEQEEQTALPEGADDTPAIRVIEAPVPEGPVADDGASGSGWALEQRLVARALLDAGQPRAAYEVAALPFAVRESDHIEAAFFAGWIALRFLDQPAKAAAHFADAAPHATLPISIARVAYWRGRAARALGKADEAQAHFAQAADHSTTYYGQLAREELGLRALAVRALPEPTAQARFDLSQMRPAQAMRLLFAAGETDLALLFLPDLARSLDDDHLAALAEEVHESGDARAALILGKAAGYRGKPFDVPAFPTFGIPGVDGAAIEEPMIYAITRQESAFDGKAVSHAGARGLMQLMPATAQATARSAGLPFDLTRLTSDPAYNARLGASHLGELVARWNGSYILAIASYNAGPGNVRKWIAAYGDPRSLKVDPVDWVERIPFAETRNYVQRVLENLQVYRARLNNETALRLSSDMERGRN
ncbi:MAG: lytic transglycosylase domain-containing protein [Pseudochelatococcus sp.]|uniref:lytic transglycosylase domain-containing protein n=1 Tax=Pseudochelatococcus sp. TaxID=2020869 RepID=UPI003D91B249